MIEQAFIISLFCVGFRITTDEQMILEIIRKPYVQICSTKWSDLNNFGKVVYYIMKPIVGCITCMSSFWSLIISFFYFQIDFTIIPVIFMVAGLNTIIYRFYEK